jgi:hypothetical protein
LLIHPLYPHHFMHTSEMTIVKFNISAFWFIKLSISNKFTMR